jgi:hypothetical protein
LVKDPSLDEPFKIGPPAIGAFMAQAVIERLLAEVQGFLKLASQL